MNFKIKGITHAKVALLTVSIPALLAGPAKADSVADRVIQNVVQNVLQNVRDQIQSRRLAIPTPGRLQFTGEEEPTAYQGSDPFAALGYAKAPLYTKAPPPAPAVPTWLYGVNLTGSADWSRSAGITTSSYGVTGAIDITKIGISSQYDALTVIFTGGGVWSNAPGTDSSTGVGAGTIAYTNGGFSVDFTIDGTWTTSRLAAAGIITNTDSTGISYAPNVQYKFDLANGFFIEPTVGATYTQTFTSSFGAQTGDSTEVHGGARFGTDTTWNGTRVQPSLKLEAFSIVAQSGISTVAVGGTGVTTPVVTGSGVATGQVGGRASGKLNILWTPTFSSFIEAHGSGISGLTAYGTTAGLRWTF
jgi:Autotransporter beta-domain